MPSGWVAILGGSVALHYLLTGILAFSGKEEAIKNLNSIFNAWLPAIASLVSAATTYYDMVICVYKNDEPTPDFFSLDFYRISLDICRSGP